MEQQCFFHDKKILGWKKKKNCELRESRPVEDDFPTIKTVG